jgi:AAA+ superfamily predicted ATPase
LTGVQLQMADAAATFAWLKRGVTMATIANAALPAPLARITVMARAADGNAALAALLFAPLPSPGSMLGMLTGNGSFTLRPPYGAVQAGFRTGREDSAIYVLRPDGGRAFGVVPGPLPNQVTVFCGDLPLLQWVTPPLKLSNVDVLQHDMELFSAVVSATAAGLYQAAGATAPDLTVQLRSSGSSEGVARDAASRFGQVVDRVTRGGAPSPPGNSAVTSDTPAERFGDVGGQDAAVAELQAVLLALASPERYREWGARAPKGVLLYGPPGTGKTLLARCLAGEAGAHFFHVRAADVVSKWYGEAEQRMQGVFEKARNATPAIVFFDEIDALAPHRDGAHEVTHRVVSTMLEYMDGLEAIEGVVIVAATNRPEALDPAIVRPGRFDRLVEIGLPGPVGRRQILEIHCRKAERRAGRPLFTEPDWPALEEASDGLSGADLSEAVRRALEGRVRSGAGGLITGEELQRELEGLTSRAF